jgi:hypothetical protein
MTIELSPLQSCRRPGAHTQTTQLRTALILRAARGCNYCVSFHGFWPLQAMIMRCFIHRMAVSASSKSFAIPIEEKAEMDHGLNEAKEQVVLEFRHTRKYTPPCGDHDECF